MILDFAGRLNIITHVLIRGEQEGHNKGRRCNDETERRERQRSLDCTLLALKMTEGLQPKKCRKFLGT